MTPTETLPEAQQQNKDKVVYLADKDMSISFPSSMNDDQISSAIRSQVYGKDQAPEIPEEGKEPFIQGIAERAAAGAMVSVEQSADFLSGGLLPRITGDPAEKYQEQIKKNLKSDNGFKNFAYDFAGSMGYVFPMITTQSWIGAFSKASQLGKIPQIANVLKNIPDFALGWGIMGAGEKVEQGANPLEAAKEGLKDMAMGLVYNKIGEMGSGGNWGQRIGKQAPLMAVASMGQYTFDSLSQEQMPTEDGYLKSFAQGIAYGAAFATVPELHLGVRGKEKDALLAFHDKVREAANKGDFEGVKNAFDELQDNDDVSRDTKEALKDTIEAVNTDITGGTTEREGVKTDPEACDVFLKESGKGRLGEEVEKVEGEVKKEEKEIKGVEDVLDESTKLDPKTSADDILARQLLEKLNIKDEDTYAIAIHDDEREILGQPKSVTLTPEQQKVSTDVVDKLNRARDIIYRKLQSKGVPVEDKIHASRFVMGKGNIWDWMKAGVERVAGGGGRYRMSDGTMKHRTMKAGVDENGNVYVLNIDGRVSYFKNGQPSQDWGAWKQSKNLDLLKKKIAPVEKKIGVLNKLLRMVESIKVKDPVSMVRIGNLHEYVYQLHDLLESDILKNIYVKSAVVRLPNGKETEAGNHEDALNQLGMSKENTTEGKEWTGHFKLSNGDVISRDEAQDRFGIRNSEDINRQKIIQDKSRQKIYSSMQAELEGIDKQISSINKEGEKLSDEDSKKSDRLEKKLSKLNNQYLNLSLSDVYENVSEWAKTNDKENEAIGKVKDDTDRKLEKALEEIKILSKIPKGEELSNAEVRANSLRKKIDELSQLANNISQQYDPSTLNGKSFVVSNRDSQYYGKKFTIRDATIPEVEYNTNVKYHKNAVLNALNSYLTYRKMERFHDFIEGIKTNKGFTDNAIKADMPPAEHPDWKGTQLRQFAGYKMRPEWADALDYLHNQFYRTGDTHLVYNAVNNFLRDAIFFNPAIHVPNVVVAYVVNRGAMKWLNPMEYPSLGRSVMRAVRAVTSLNQDYIDHQMAGGNLMYSKVSDKTLQAYFREKLNLQIDNQHPAITEMMRSFGHNIYGGWGDIVHKTTWWTNDVLTMAATFEAEASGMSKEAAVDWTGKFIPNYIKPARIFGSYELAEKFNNPMYTMFASYHYGILKGYGEMLRMIAPDILKDNPVGEKVFGKFQETTGKEKIEALSKVAMLGVLGYVLYPAMDRFWQGVTGNKRASVRRSGYLSIPEDIVEVMKRQKDFPQAVQDAITPAIGVKIASELWTNRDWFSGKSVFSPADDIPQELMNFVTPNVAPITQGARIASGKVSLGNWLLSQAGIKMNDKNVERLYLMRSDKEEAQRTVDELYQKDPNKAIKKAESFNKMQLKQLEDIAKTDGIKIPQSIVNQFIITGAKDKSGEEPVKSNDSADMLKKHKTKRRKKIFTGEEEGSQEQNNQEWLEPTEKRKSLLSRTGI